MRGTVSAVLFGVFLFVAVFGLPMVLSHGGHGEGCPLMAAAEVMCESTIIEHVSLWQSMFVSILVLFLFCIALAPIARRNDAAYVPERVRIRLRDASRKRPTLLQKLLARGILHSKEF